MIDLEVKKDKKFYYFSVKDNGVGFKIHFNKKATLKGGFGLLSITERLDNIKGNLKIKSDEGKGTEATIVIPINED